ncbi:MAG: hypothetical protein ACOY9Y_11040 [Bacillota bacterium]
MILVIKNSKVIATHTDEQTYIIDRYPVECEIIKVADNAVEFTQDEEGRQTGLPEDPRLKGVPYVNLKTTPTAEQRLEALEIAMLTNLGL